MRIVEGFRVGGEGRGGAFLMLCHIEVLGVHFTLNSSSNPVSYFLSAKRRNGSNKRHIHELKNLPKSSPKAGWLGLGQQCPGKKKTKWGKKSKGHKNRASSYF